MKSNRRPRWKSAAPSAHTRNKRLNSLVCEASAIAGFEINTGAGDDVVTLGRTVPVPATIRGGEGNDVLTGGAGADKLIGGPGDDELVGRGGNDWLIGGSGDDVLNGGAGDDHLSGGPGHNTLIGGSGKNLVEWRCPAAQVAAAARRGINAPPTKSRLIATPTRAIPASSRKPAWKPSMNGGTLAEKTVVVSPRPIEPPAIWNM